MHPIFNKLFYHVRSFFTGSGWPTEIYVVRHGESLQNMGLIASSRGDQSLWDNLREKGDHEVELSRRGKQQAQFTGRALAKLPKFDVVFVSPYIRTNQTAEEIISQLGYEPEIKSDDTLAERSLGYHQNLTPDELAKKHPEQIQYGQRMGVYYPPEGGESLKLKRLELDKFVDKLRRKYRGKRVLVVTHLDVMQILHAKFESIPTEQIPAQVKPPNASVQKYVLDLSKDPYGRMKHVEGPTTFYSDSLSSTKSKK